MTERARLYARVSTEEQTEGYSIDAQRRAFQLLCQSKGWTPDYEYIEEGKSAHTDNIRKRPAFKQAIDDALAGKYDVLVYYSIGCDRPRSPWSQDRPQAWAVTP